MIPIEYTWPYIVIGFGAGGISMWMFLRLVVDATMETVECRGAEQYHVHEGQPVRDHDELPENVVRYLRQK
jgi:hypothetical protein